MGRFLLYRLFQNVILLFIVSMVGYAILHLAPGGPLSRFALTPGMTQAELARLAEQMGLNRPLPVQYWDWFTDLVTGDWGTSFRDNQPVLQKVLDHLWPTLELIIASTLIAVLLGSWIGILGAIRRYSTFDYLATIGAMIALSIPTFWFGLIVIFFFTLELGLLPSGNRVTIGDGSFLDWLHHLIAPAMVLSLVTVAIWSRYMRSSMLEVVNQDYIRTARAKGLPERAVLIRHAVRNAILPMISVLAVQLPTLLSGALVTETVFTWPGLGRLFIDSLGYRDYPVVMGILMFSAIIVLLANWIADILYAVVDPRIRID